MSLVFFFRMFQILCRFQKHNKMSTEDFSFFLDTWPVFELVAVNSPYYDENTCDQLSLC